MARFHIEPRRPLMVSAGRTTHIDGSATKRGPAGPRGPEGPGVGETVASIASERGLRAVRAALSTGTARVVAMGDSKTEGAGVSATADRWLNMLQADLRARYAPTLDQGMGYLPAYYATFWGFSSAPVFAGDVTRTESGLGRRSARMASGGSVTWAVPAWTSGALMLLHYTQAPGAGDLEVVAGGTVRATVSTAGAARSTVANALIPAGTTEITVRHKSGTGDGTATVEGIFHATTSTGSGISVWDAAKSGGKVVDFTGGAPADRHWEAISLVDPHLIVAAFGANDMSPPPGGRTVRQWAADLSAFVDRARTAAPGAGIVLLHGAQRTEEAGDPTRLLAFEAAARDAIGDDPDVTILHESALWAPVVGEDYSDGDDIWLSDTVHTNATGNAAIARHLLAAIASGDGTGEAPTITTSTPEPGVVRLSW